MERQCSVKCILVCLNNHIAGTHNHQSHTSMLHASSAGMQHLVQGKSTSQVFASRHMSDKTQATRTSYNTTMHVTYLSAKGILGVLRTLVDVCSLGQQLTALYQFACGSVIRRQTRNVFGKVGGFAIFYNQCPQKTPTLCHNTKPLQV